MAASMCSSARSRRPAPRQARAAMIRSCGSSGDRRTASSKTGTASSNRPDPASTPARFSRAWKVIGRHLQDPFELTDRTIEIAHECEGECQVVAKIDRRRDRRQPAQENPVGSLVPAVGSEHRSKPEISDRIGGIDLHDPGVGAGRILPPTVVDEQASGEEVALHTVRHLCQRGIDAGFCPDADHHRDRPTRRVRVRSRRRRPGSNAPACRAWSGHPTPNAAPRPSAAATAG